jgi:hypothetical protein
MVDVMYLTPDRRLESLRGVKCDGSRKRRLSSNPAKQRWYARWRTIRFARKFGVHNLS